MSQTSSPSTPRLARLRPWLLALGLCCLGLYAYGNSYRGTFVYDEGLCLTEPSHAIAYWWPPADKEGRRFTTGGRRWLTHLTFVANYKLHGYHVVGYHVVNNAIHIAAGLLLFGLVRRSLLLPRHVGEGRSEGSHDGASEASFGKKANPHPNPLPRGEGTKAADWLAFACAALWLVHPLQTESVTYVIQRLESLAGMLFLLTLYLFLRGSQSRWAWAWYLPMVAVVWLGTGSKETMYLAPLALLLFDRAFLSASWKSVMQQRWQLYALTLPALAYAAYSLRSSFSPEQKPLMGFGFQDVTPWEYLRSQPEVILHYLKLSFWPAEMCIDYGWRVQHDPRIIFGLGAIIVALVIASLALLYYRPRVGFVAFLFFLVLAPTSSIMPIRDLAFEHRMYLPLASVAILTVLGLYALCRRILKEPVPRIALPAGLIALAIVGLTLRTRERNRIYYEPATVWRESIERSPWHARGAYNLGQSLVHKGMMPGGAAQYYALLIRDPRQVERLGNRDGYAEIQGDLAEAAKWLRRAAELDPTDDKAHFNLGGLHDRARQADEAIKHYRQTLAVNAKHLHAKMNLARLLNERGETQEAELLFRSAIEQAPRDARTYTNFGKALQLQGRHSEAIEQFRAASQAQPEHISSRYRLAVSQWELGEEREAILGLREIRKASRGLSDVNLTLARYLATTREQELFAPAEGAAIAQQTLASGTATEEAREVLALCEQALARTREVPVSAED